MGVFCNRFSVRAPWVTSQERDDDQDKAPERLTKGITDGVLVTGSSASIAGSHRKCVLTTDSTPAA